jgi:hypothetical protein
MRQMMTALMGFALLYQVFGILKFLRNQGLSTTYVPIAKTFGLFSGGTDLARVLGEIQEEDDKNGDPFHSSLVVGAERGIPGNGYFDHARKLGRTIPKTPADELLFWAGQMKALGVPYPQAAVDYAAKIGVTLP